MEKLERFNPSQIIIVNNAAAMAEELVSNHYKMSTSQWLRLKYDVKTLDDIAADEIVLGPFAQIVRYEGRLKDMSLGSATYDFYKICLQDHSIIATLNRHAGMRLFPFSLYIVTHELIHIVRFCKFLQNFDASPEEKLIEETRVHADTHKILYPVQVPGLVEVLQFYHKWREPLQVADDQKK